MKRTYIDIETSPLSDNWLAEIIKPFDPDEVKTGNIKDPHKIAAKVQECEEKHFTDFKKKAALSPMTGKVIAIGIQIEGSMSLLFEDDFPDGEKEILEIFWKKNAVCDTQEGFQLIGFNIKEFDLPFLITRSWKHGLCVPILRTGRYFDSQKVIDLRDEWTHYERNGAGTLSQVCKFFGLPSKEESGKDFHTWERPKQNNYLTQDIKVLPELRKMMQIY